MRSLPASSARSAARAIAALLERLRLTTACVSRIPLVVRSADKVRYEMTFPPPQVFVRLNVVPPLRFAVRQDVVARRDDQSGLWMTYVVGYRYEVQNERDTATGTNAGIPKEVLAFDWHPDGRSSVTTPHVHVHSEGTRLSRKHHIPTGPVSLASAVRFLIAELGVAPVWDDWQTVLQAEGAG